MTTRRLILCLDGTWNSNDKSDAITNVVKLMRLIPCMGADGICLGKQLDELLAIRRSDQTPELKRQAIAAITGLRRHEPAPIKCIGVWDTVGSLGIPGDWARHKPFASRWYFHNVHLGPHVDVALHALAIDENRPAFPPTLWEKPVDQPLPVPYRPPNLAEVIRQARLPTPTQTITIVDWDGEPIEAVQQHWPSEQEQPVKRG